MKTELQELANYITAEEGIKPITVDLKEVRTGRSRPLTRKVTIPKWTIREGVVYVYYYTIHEISHFLCAEKHLGYGHNAGFKNIESKWLKEFGLLPIYSKAYVKGLRNLNGDTIWKRSWKK